MNALKRAITAQVSPSSHPSRKWRFLMYSTSYTLNPPKPRKRVQVPPPPAPPPPLPPPPPSSSASAFERVKDEVEELTEWPRPTEIHYQSKVANLVNLIGHVRTPIKFQTSPDGKYWAGTVIYRENGPQGSCLIPVMFEDDLAHIVTCHVKENDCVYVIGQLSEGPIPFLLSATTGLLHLRVQNINFVKDFEKDGFEQGDRIKFGENLVSGSNDIVMPLKGDDKVEQDGVEESTVSAYRKVADTNKKKGEDSVEDSWRDLMRNSKQWLDYRQHKAKGLVTNKYPDFKNKDTGVALWLRSAPRWVLGGLLSLKFDVPPEKPKQVKDDGKPKLTKDAKEELWKSLAENPNQWWDNRLDKKNPKAPDFKHKQSGEVLWKNSLPDWVLSKLPPTREKENAAAGGKTAA